MTKKQTPTMKDVVREAGVSLGTVSKVVNGIPVGENHRKHVEAAMKKLHYQVNHYARGLKTNKTNCIALVMPSSQHPFFAALVDALTTSLMKAGYRALLLITNFDSVTENHCFTLAQQNKLDGFIALSYSQNMEINDSVPIVTIDRHFSNNIPCVSSDNYQSGVMAAEKLIGLGCENLLFLRIGSNVHGEVEKRGFGFEIACRMAGVRYQSLILEEGEQEETFFRFLEEHIQDEKLELDGIFCNTDTLALLVWDFLKSREIRVPQDVQIIGYDGIKNFATGCYLCSTIVQPISQMAETAVRMLLNGGNEQTAANIALPVQYAIGGSTRE